MSTPPETRWYYVAADYKSTYPGREQRRNLWERRVFVFQAAADRAEQSAIEIAKEHEHEYLNSTGEMIRVAFMGVESWAELFDKTIGQGTEVYWDWNMSIDRPKSFWRTRPVKLWPAKARRRRRPGSESKTA